MVIGASCLLRFQYLHPTHGPQSQSTSTPHIKPNPPPTSRLTQENDMSAAPQIPPLRRSDATHLLPQAAIHVNTQAVGTNNNHAITNNSQHVDRLNGQVGLRNFLDEDPAVHIQEQEVDEAIKDPVPPYTPTPGRGELTVEILTSGQHTSTTAMEGLPPPYKRKRNKLQKRRPEDRR